jgi:peptidyl-prolyl cis-trans isomerase D
MGRDDSIPATRRLAAAPPHPIIMLQAIRSKASSIFAKLLFGLLVVSFAVWGIGDIFRNRGVDTAVATVGGRKIDVLELKQQARKDEEQWRRMLNDPRTDFRELDRQHQIVGSALQGLVRQALVDLEIDRLRLAVGEDTVEQLIRTNRAFLDARGTFDPMLYKQYVASQRMSAPQLKATLRSDLIREHLSQAIVAGVKPPAELVDVLYRLRAERRVADVVALPPTAVADPGTPSDDEAKAYYEAHKDEFAVPPLLSFTVGLLRVDDVAPTVEVPEDKLREEYQNRLDQFHTPEKRRLQQILLTDEAKAREAAAQLAQGKDFEAVAKDVAQLEPKDLDIDFFAKSELPPLLGDPVFALKQGEVTAPLQDPQGWHILRVSEITPEHTEPFEAVKDALAKDIAREMASDRITKQERRIEDAVAEGLAFAEVAQRFDMKPVKIENVDKNGLGRDGTPVALPPGSDDMLERAFATAVGQIGQIGQLADGAGDYLLHVDGQTPETTKPLEEVMATVVQRWRQEKRDAALAALAKDIAAEVKDGKTLADVAAARKLTLFATEPLTRTSRNAKVPPTLVASIFEAKPNSAVFVRGGDVYLVAELKAVLPPDPAQAEKDVAGFADRLIAPGMRDDLLQEFDQALRRHFPVSIDEPAVERAF